MSILDTIITYKKDHMDQLKKEYAHQVLKAKKTSKRSLIKSIEANNNMTIISEIKRGSPSKGLFSDSLDIVQQTSIYSQDASAISVLTDQNFFYGSFEDLKKVKEHTQLPVLCKDFIIDDFQLKVADYMGADLVLLIARVLSHDQLAHLLNEAYKLDLEVLVEVHSLEEFEKIKHLDFKLCGVNNRNLDDFSISLDHTRSLANHIKSAGKLLITESGIYNRDQLISLRNDGIDGALIGESLIKEPELLRQLKVKRTPTKIKLCGLKTLDQVKLADDLKVDFIGLVFAESKRQINVDQALSLRPYIKQAKLVGVFKDQSPELIESIYHTCQLDMVQIHGDFDFSKLKISRNKIIRAIHYKDSHPIGFPYLLIDGKIPGSGQTYQTDQINLTDRQNYILAGGLTVNNVKEKVAGIHVAGVDISSGIEVNGIKNPSLMNEFVAVVRSI